MKQVEKFLKKGLDSAVSTIFPKCKLPFFLIFIFLSSHSFSQTTIEYNVPVSPYKGYCYHQTIGYATYWMDDAIWVGFYQPNDQEYFRYRQAQRYNVSTIPSYAAIVSATLEFYSGSTYGAQRGKIKLTNIRYDFQTQSSETVYGLIYSGTALGQTPTITYYQKYSVSSNALKQVVQTAIQSSVPSIGIGAYNLQEYDNGGTDLFDPHLKGTYTIPTPAAVTNLATSSVTPSSCVLSWTAPAVGGGAGAATGYYVKINSQLYSTTSLTSIVINGLCPGINYTLRVIPFNDYGNGPERSVNCLTPATAITGPTLVCSGGAYTLINLPPNNTITWTSSQNIVRISDQGSNPCTFNVNGNGPSWVGAEIHSNNCDYIVPHFNFWAGKPLFNSINGPYEGYIYEPYTFWANPMRDPLSQSEYEWMVEPSYYNYYFMYYYYDWVTIVFYDPNDYYLVIARAVNSCGLTNWIVKNVAIHDDYFFSISPNPASDIITVTISKPNSINTTANQVMPIDYMVRIIDFNGIQYYSGLKSGPSFTLSVSNLRDGNYFVNISYGKKTKNLQLIIKH